MRLLLDTHALLWWWADDARLGIAARTAIADEGNEVLVNAASAWEIATKQGLGKLAAQPADAGEFAALLRADGFGHLAVTHRHAWQAGSLAVEHRDPFDRMLAAQAQLEGLVLVSVDPVFAGEFGQRVLW